MLSTQKTEFLPQSSIKALKSFKKTLDALQACCFQPQYTSTEVVSRLRTPPVALLASIQTEPRRHWTRWHTFCASMCSQRYDWPVARPVDGVEVLTIELFVRSRLFADKLLGTYGVVLQRVVRDSRVSVNDCLVDDSNRPIPVSKHSKLKLELKLKCYDDVRASPFYGPFARMGNLCVCLFGATRFIWLPFNWTI